MEIGGWRTRSVFIRYNIVAPKQKEQAMELLQQANENLMGRAMDNYRKASQIIREDHLDEPLVCIDVLADGSCVLCPLDQLLRVAANLNTGKEHNAVLLHGITLGADGPLVVDHLRLMKPSDVLSFQNTDRDIIQSRIYTVTDEAKASIVKVLADYNKNKKDTLNFKERIMFIHDPARKMLDISVPTSRATEHFRREVQTAKFFAVQIEHPLEGHTQHVRVVFDDGSEQPFCLLVETHDFLQHNGDVTKLHLPTIDTLTQAVVLRRCDSGTIAPRPHH
jgi:hypothetical protein